MIYDDYNNDKQRDTVVRWIATNMAQGVDIGNHAFVTHLAITMLSGTAMCLAIPHV